MKGASVSPKGCKFLLLHNPGFFTSLNKGSRRTEEREQTLPVHCCGLPGRKGQDLLGGSLNKHTQVVFTNSMKAEAVKPCKV